MRVPQCSPPTPCRMQELLAANFVVTSLKTLSSLSSLSDDEFKVGATCPISCIRPVAAPVDYCWYGTGSTDPRHWADRPTALGRPTPSNSLGGGNI